MLVDLSPRHVICLIMVVIKDPTYVKNMRLNLVRPSESDGYVLDIFCSVFGPSLEIHILGLAC